MLPSLKSPIGPSVPAPATGAPPTPGLLPRSVAVPVVGPKSRTGWLPGLMRAQAGREQGGSNLLQRTVCPPFNAAHLDAGAGPLCACYRCPPCSAETERARLMEAGVPEARDFLKEGALVSLNRKAGSRSERLLSHPVCPCLTAEARGLARLGLQLLIYRDSESPPPPSWPWHPWLCLGSTGD